MTAKLTKEQFIEKAKAVHGNKYDYSKVDYVNNSTPVIIICPTHGEFQQKPNKHVDSKQGCPLCGKKQSTVFPAYEERFPVIEGKKYVVTDPKSDFSTDDYRNKSGVISTYLKKTYNIESGMSSFKERNYFKLYNHYWWEEHLEIRLVDDIIKETIQCPYCDWSTTDLENKSGIMITHFKKIHNKTLEEILLEHPEMKNYFHNSKSVDFRAENEYVICQICGKKFTRLNSSHLNTHNITTFEYAQKYHSPRLSQVYYNHCVITANHMNKVNGENDNSFTSKIEREIKEFLRNHNIQCNKNRSILNGKELDIYIPNHNLAIEYNGCKWHTEWFGGKDKHYHYDKMIECNSKGVRLIHIFEDEYMCHKDIVLSKIGHILGMHQDLPKVGARKCKIQTILKFPCDVFLNANHIQGAVSASVYYGAFTPEGDLAAVMTFVKRKDNEYELNRFATNNRMVVSGIADRILKRFIKDYNPSKIISFADRRWTTNLESNLYTKLGFTLEYCTKPDYHYYNEKVDRFQRFHKFGFRKQQLHNKYGFDMSMTEEEMVRELGYDRIWDCGLAKYVYINPNFN